METKRSSAPSRTPRGPSKQYQSGWGHVMRSRSAWENPTMWQYASYLPYVLIYLSKYVYLWCKGHVKQPASRYVGRRPPARSEFSSHHQLLKDPALIVTKDLYGDC